MFAPAKSTISRTLTDSKSRWAKIVSEVRNRRVLVSIWAALLLRVANLSALGGLLSLALL